MKSADLTPRTSNTREAGVYVLGAIIGVLVMAGAYAYAYARWGWANG